MDENATKVLIISRDSLRRVQDSNYSSKVFRRLAKITRKGHHLMLTAAEPDQWLPTRGNVDSALAQQNSLQSNISAAGGDLDGVYYVPRSLFTQDRNREGALKDILQRYSAEANRAVLFSSSMPFVKAAKRLGIDTYKLSDDEKGYQTFEKQLKNMFG